ncbi:hypothetical protein V6N13_069728 [Hibiscus sabdariffa]
MRPFHRTWPWDSNLRRPPKPTPSFTCNARSVFIRYLDRPLHVAVYGEHSYPVTVARYSPNGEWIASADVSGVIRIWGTHNDFVLKNEFKVLSGRIDDLQWSPDGMRIVACGDGKGKSFVRAFMGHSNFVNCIRFSPDGSKLISVSSDKKVIIYDAKTGETKGTFSSEDGHTGSIYAVSWSGDSKHVITVSADKTAKIWEISEDGAGKLTKTLQSAGSGGVEDMLVGCLWQNDHIITVSLAGTINLYSASDLDKQPICLSGHMKNVNTLTLLESSEKTILSSSFDGSIFRWIPGTGYSGKLRRKDSSQIKCLVAFKEEIMTSGYDNKVTSYELVIAFQMSSRMVWRISLDQDKSEEAEHIDVGSQPKDLSQAINSPELALVSTDSGVLLLKDLKVFSSINLGFAVTASVIAPDGSEAIVGGQDGKLHIYSVSGDSLTKEATLEKHRGPISVIRYSPDFSMFASGDLNREAVVWDRTSKEVKLNNMLFHTARINCLAWSPDNTMVATGSLDTNVIIYEIAKPASSRITIKLAHPGGVYGLVFIDDCNVVSSGEDACVRVWKIEKQ